jgi:large subunit ribosomal protein L10
MPNQQNQNAVKDLEAKLDGVSAVYLADYAGLTVKEQVKLRQLVTAAGGDLKIAKNSLLNIALKNKGVDTTPLTSDLTGPNVTLFATSDAVAPLKALVEFAKANEKELPKIKAGILGKEVLSREKVVQLSKLPSKLELLAKLLGTLTNPARNLVGVLSAPTRNFVYALAAINKKQAQA